MIKKSILFIFFIAIGTAKATTKSIISQATYSNPVHYNVLPASDTSVNYGSRLDYKFFLFGQTATINFIPQKTSEGIMLSWNLRGATGSYLIPDSAVAKGTHINFVQPAPQTVLKLKADETFGMVSQEALKTLKKNRQFIYNQTTYVQQGEIQQFQAGDRSLSVFHVIGKEEPAEMWILDNDQLPIVCQMKNNPLNINFSLVGLK